MALKKPNLMSIFSSFAPEVWVVSKRRMTNGLGIKKKEEGTHTAVLGMPLSH